jgi:hypothetical protein
MDQPVRQAGLTKSHQTIQNQNKPIWTESTQTIPDRNLTKPYKKQIISTETEKRQNIDQTRPDETYHIKRTSQRFHRNANDLAKILSPIIFLYTLAIRNMV